MASRSRRKVLQQLASLVGAYYGLPACKSTRPDGYGVKNEPGTLSQDLAAKARVRKSILTLNRQSPDIVAFEKAINRMRALQGDYAQYVDNVPGRSGHPFTMVLQTPPPELAQSWPKVPKDGRSWFRQAQIHWDHCAHGTMHFLSWHRVYLFWFEELIRHHSEYPDFALPYWDWSEDQRLPELFVPEFFEGGSANPLFSPRRSAPRPEIPVTSVGAERLSRVLAMPSFERFSQDLEGSPHGSVHVFIGGEMGAFMSPLDPIFWCHHCNIDRIWEIWRQAVGPGRDAPQDVETWGKTELGGFFDVQGREVKDQAIRTLNMTANFGYSYDKMSLPKAPEPAPVPAPTVVVAEERADASTSISTSASASESHASQGETSLPLARVKPKGQSVVFALPLQQSPEVVLAAEQSSISQERRGYLDGQDEPSGTKVFLELAGITRPERQDMYLKVYLVTHARELPVSDFYFFDHPEKTGFRFQCELAAPVRQALAGTAPGILPELHIVLRLATTGGQITPYTGPVQSRLVYQQDKR